MHAVHNTKKDNDDEDEDVWLMKKRIHKKSKTKHVESC